MVKPKQKKLVPPFLAGSLHKKYVMDILQVQASKKSKTLSKSAKSNPVSKPKKSTSDVCKKQQTSKSKAKKSVPTPEPLPGTSGLITVVMRQVLSQWIQGVTFLWRPMTKLNVAFVTNGNRMH